METAKIFSEDVLTEVVTVLKALADPTRLKIIDILMDGETCSCEFTEQLEVPANLLSHHLRTLKKAKLITGRRDSVDGRWIYYSLNKDALARWQQLLGEFLDPARIEHRKCLCGPEGQSAPIDPSKVMVETN